MQQGSWQDQLPCDVAWLRPTIRLRYVGGEDNCDVRERVVEAGGEVAHAGDGAEGDQSDDERVLNEVLTFFTLNERLRYEVEFHQIHLQILHFLGWGSSL